MTQSISSEVATRADSNPLAVINRYQTSFARALPAFIRGDVDRWARVAESAVKRNPQLVSVVKNDNGASLMQALIECARLGHEPGTDHFYLIPKGGKVVGWEGYRGMISRILRSGNYRKVVAQVIFENDEFAFDPNSDEIPTHKFDYFGADRGKPVSAYAYAIHHNGTPTAVAIATTEKINVAKKNSMGSSSASSPWNAADGAMHLKVAIKDLMKFVDASAEDRRIPNQAVAVRADNPETETAIPEAQPATDDNIEDAEIYDVTGYPEVDQA